MEGGLAHACAWIVKRDLLLFWRHRAEAANPVLFFFVIALIFPLGLGPDPQMLESVGPGVIWIAALLATLLSLEAVFHSDLEDGSLEQLLLSPHPLTLLVMAKILAHWLTAGLPLLLLAPILGLQFGIAGYTLGVLLLTLILGTPALSLMGAIGVALTSGLRAAGILATLLLLPLYVPILIFATGATAAANRGLAWGPQLYMLGALLMLAITLAPLAAAAALRIRNS
ncbi:MAG: heme exporter protein CcmB [Gammaproteobacteria bacterium]